VVCLNRPMGSALSGVEENQEMVGAAAIDLVATQIMSNSHGLPAHPKLILIEGTWVDGETMRFNPKTAIGGDEMAQDAGR
jgi:LacI family transcriptional regulator